MKFSTPNFLLNVNSPFEGELRLKEFVSGSVVIGVDEVGRGPLAGPVVACAAVLKDSFDCPSLNDSKKLSRKKREEIFEQVKDSCLCYAIASASVEEIDNTNILEANFLAMRRALDAIGVKGLSVTVPELSIESKGSLLENTSYKIAVDGNLLIRGVLAENQIAVVKGDMLVASISAASILAKVYRDRLMDSLAKQYPMYGFEANAGYGTKKHLDAIREFGFSPVHRKSFRPKGI